MGKRVSSCVLAVGLLLVAISPRVTQVWDGSYPQAEFELIFKDAHGVALQGIQLRVEDQEGRSYFHYPVIDYLPGNVPTSDRDGAMVFHHVSDGIEFSGRTTYWFGMFPIVEQRAPVFVCRFLRDGQEVYRIRFRELCRSTDATLAASKVKRVWKWPVWPESQLLMQVRGDEDLRDRKLRLFDLNGDGKLDAEEQAALTAAANQADRAAFAQLRGDEEKEEFEFAVIRKTIVVECPGPAPSTASEAEKRTPPKGSR